MNETQHIEAYLHQNLPPEEQVLMDAKLLLNSGLHGKVMWQKKSYDLIKVYGRKSLREDIQKAQTRVFTEKRFTAFQQLIHRLFNL